ncbi:MAG: hypothetical protein ABSC10_05005 [Candidatus Acidiferrales bacterium]|jgi:hypothetical protein
MKFAISMTALFMLLGSTAITYARQEKGQEGHSEGGHAQAAKPAEQHAQPAQHAQQAKPAAQHAQAAPRTQSAKPAAQAHTTSTSHAQQTHTATNQSHAAQSHSSAANRDGGGSHGRISDAHYNASFGSGHSFHVNRGDYDRHRFAYGGYNFGFGAPWPVGWGYDDDVYVMYTDGGYYMYDRFHPGLRLSINIE